MGRTLSHLASGKVDERAIFDHRFVVEICEKVHVHYRNLRILMSLTDWIEFAKGNASALERWQKQGSPEPSDISHIELCRRVVAKYPQDENTVRINLNDNLYNKNEGKIFAEGANFSDEKYIHLKIRDLRVELSLNDFNALADAVIEAKSKL